VVRCLYQQHPIPAVSRNTSKLNSVERTNIVGMKGLWLERKTGTIQVGPDEDRRVAMLKKEDIELGSVEGFDWTTVDHGKIFRP
jgi:hypothetical protein